MFINIGNKKGLEVINMTLFLFVCSSYTSFLDREWMTCWILKNVWKWQKCSSALYSCYGKSGTIQTLFQIWQFFFIFEVSQTHFVWSIICSLLVFRVAFIIKQVSRYASWFSVLFHWPVCLSLCPYYILLVTIDYKSWYPVE